MGADAHKLERGKKCLALSTNDNIARCSKDAQNVSAILFTLNRNHKYDNYIREMIMIVIIMIMIVKIVIRMIE